MIARALLVAVLALSACGTDRHAAVEARPVPSVSVPVTASSEPAPGLDAASTPPATPVASAAAPPPAPEDDDSNHLPWPDGYVPPEIWEKRVVAVDGASETWSLRWRKPPHFNACTPGMGCPCDGIEWGVQGDLELVREQPGAPVERLSLADLREGGAQIRGFVSSPLDRVPEFSSSFKSLESVVKRRRAQLLQLRDYDHDGWATEFVFYVGYVVCGTNPSVLVGVSKANPHLHAFGTVQDPDQPLEMNYRSTWDRILAARGKTIEVPQRACGDHGLDGYYVTLGFEPAGFRVLDAGEWDCDWKHDRSRRTVRLPPNPPAPPPPAGAADAGASP